MGLENTHLTWKQTVDPSGCNAGEENYEKFSRDGCRTPFPWDDSTSAGFSTNSSTWLPVKEDYKAVNVKMQEAATHSHLKIFKALMQLRKKNVLRRGQFDIKLVNDENVMIYRRWYGNEDLVVVILNFSKTSQTVNVKEAFTMITEDTLKIHTASLEILEAGRVAG